MQDVPIVLVVEDEESLQEIVHDALKDGGFDLTTVASGQEAVAMIESGVVKYSALVTDINPQRAGEGLGDCAPCQANRSCISRRLHDGRRRRRLGVGGSAQQHSAEKTVCSSATGYGGVTTAQYRFADFRVSHFCYWHLCDMPTGGQGVRLSG